MTFLVGVRDMPNGEHSRRQAEPSARYLDTDAVRARALEVAEQARMLRWVRSPISTPATSSVKGTSRRLGWSP